MSTTVHPRELAAVGAAARHDERLEAVGAQVDEQFLHRLIGQLVVRPVPARMTRVLHPGYRSPEGLDAVVAAQGERFDLVLGRRTYDIWSGYWPQAPSSPIAGSINAATKYVAFT